MAASLADILLILINGGKFVGKFVGKFDARGGDIWKQVLPPFKD
jgi:hypothetical protein